MFAVLFLDNRHRLIEYVELFRGTIDCASVYPREVVKEALARNAAAVIVSCRATIQARIPRYRLPAFSVWWCRRTLNGAAESLLFP